MASPRLALLPRTGPWPGGALFVAPALALVALFVTGEAAVLPGELLPGAPGRVDGPGTWNLHWAIHTRGLLATTAWTLRAWPTHIDNVALQGFPLDALSSWPFTALLGWPAGLAAWVWAVVFALGASTAWLAGLTWRSVTAALVAGVAAQVGSAAARELWEGRPTLVMASVFLPLCWGWASRALVSGRMRPALASGAALALAGLTWWFALPLGLLPLLVLGGLAAQEGLLRPRVVAAGAAGTLLVGGLSLAHALLGLASQPGVTLGGTSLVTHGGNEVVLAMLTHQRALTPDQFVAGAHALRPVFLVLLGLGLAAGPPRRRVFAATAAALCGLLALGPWLDLPDGTTFPLPYRLVLELPVLQRWWWPERALLVAAPLWAVLAGGGARAIAARLRHPVARFGLGAALGLLLVSEAVLRSPWLPLPGWRAGPTAAAHVLAGAPGPVLILPSPSGAFDVSTQAFLDQVHHGRPLVNGPMHPADDNAPQPWRELARTPGLSWLFGCEAREVPGGGPADPAAAVASLRALGLSAVHLEWSRVLARTAHVDPSAYRACVEALLGPADGAAGPFLVYPLDRPSG